MIYQQKYQLDDADKMYALSLIFLNNEKFERIALMQKNKRVREFEGLEVYVNNGTCICLESVSELYLSSLVPFRLKISISPYKQGEDFINNIKTLEIDLGKQRSTKSNSLI